MAAYDYYWYYFLYLVLIWSGANLWVFFLSVNRLRPECKQWITRSEHIWLVSYRLIWKCTWFICAMWSEMIGGWLHGLFFELRLTYWMDLSTSYPIKMENFHKIQSSLEPRISSANQYLTRLECACTPCICEIAHFKRCVEMSYAWRDAYFYWHIFFARRNHSPKWIHIWEIMPTNRSIHSLFSSSLCLHIKINFITFNSV